MKVIFESEETDLHLVYEEGDMYIALENAEGTVLAFPVDDVQKLVDTIKFLSSKS